MEIASICFKLSVSVLFLKLLMNFKINDNVIDSITKIKPSRIVLVIKVGKSALK
ncbi:unnamed protein product [marine sediment metagenome]|uniref:Uncharacterized protein n=1 Tax=marine sediment metagenome TaxID=412755 RepID=X1DTI3_9ZZZZ